jgi:hypothetical protein
MRVGGPRLREIIPGPAPRAEPGRTPVWGPELTVTDNGVFYELL